MHSIVIFASGTGTNAKAIIEHFKKNGKAQVSLIVSNKVDAGVIEIAEREQIPFLIVNNHTIHETLLLEQLDGYEPSLIVLAGFLWKIPMHLLREYPNRIVNIHPALLPGFGGKGMYGAKVHDAVLTAKEKESGITIHYVNEVYDAGRVIMQARCPVKEKDTADKLAKRIHKLEHFYYPRTIEFLLDEMGQPKTK